ncbi:MAG: hypothetical protein ACREI2_14550 [Nitrospiraceae bacterium]
MKRITTKTRSRRLAVVVLTTLAVGSIAAGGCVRLPYTTRVLHEDPRVRVTLQKEVEPAGYTHPVQLSAAEVASLLRGFSIREQQRLPLRWFAEEVPPKPVFREDEVQALAPHLADALQKVGPEERVHFELLAPGFNPRYRKDTNAGWVAVRDPYLYLMMEYFHTQIPVRKSDQYDYNYPTPPPPPKDYLLYFEPGRFWVTNGKGKRAVEFRPFLQSAELPVPRGTRPIPPAGAP